MYAQQPNYQISDQSGDKSLENFLLTLLAFIVLVSIGTGIYFGVKAFNSTKTSDPTSTNTCETGKTYDTVYKKCLRTCPTGFEPIDDKDDCYIICENGKTRCGKNECIDLSQQSCIDDKSCKIQNVRNYKENSVSKQECCKDNEYVNNVKDSTDQICSSCDNTICGNQCCPKEIRSVNPSSKDPFDTELFENKNPGPICVNSKMCCDQNFISNNICCQTPLCGTNCCDVNEGCYEGKCKTKCGEAFCSDTEVCLEGLGSKKCIPEGCPWNDIYYDPKTVTSYFTEENKPTFYTSKDFFKNKYVIPTCSVSPYSSTSWLGWSSTVTPEPNTPLYVTKDSSARKLQSKVMTTLDDKSNPKCLDPLACFQKIYQKGVTNVKDLTNVNVNDLTVSGNTCTGKLSCDIRLPTIADIENKCPIRDDKANFSLQCCGDPNDFKGEVCPDSQVCFYDNKDSLNKCYSAVRDQTIYNTKYCNGGRASVNNKQIVCDCTNLGIDVKFLNKDCGKLLIEDYYNDDWLRKHVDNATKFVLGEEEFGMKIYKWSWVDFLVVMINCEKLTYKKWTSVDKRAGDPDLGFNITKWIQDDKTGVLNTKNVKNYFPGRTYIGDYISASSWEWNKGLSFQLISSTHGTYYNCIFNSNPYTSPPWYKEGSDQGWGGNWRNNAEIKSNLPEHSKLYQPDWYRSNGPTIFVVYGSKYADGTDPYY